MKLLILFILVSLVLTGCGEKISPDVESTVIEIPNEHWSIVDWKLYLPAREINAISWDGGHARVVKNYTVERIYHMIPCYVQVCLPVKDTNETRCAYEKTSCKEDLPNDSIRFGTEDGLTHVVNGRTITTNDIITVENRRDEPIFVEFEGWMDYAMRWY